MSLGKQLSCGGITGNIGYRGVIDPPGLVSTPLSLALETCRDEGGDSEREPPAFLLLPIKQATTPGLEDIYP